MIPRSVRLLVYLVALTLCLPVLAADPEVITANCDQAGLLGAVSTANSGGGTIQFNCQNTTISLTQGLGDILSNVVIDGGSNNITIEYTGSFDGCVGGDNGIGAPAIGRIKGGGSVVRGLTFKNFLESLQVDGPDTLVENNSFIAHSCSDDGLSTISFNAMDVVIRNNYMEGYNDKAIQMSYGGGLIEGNTFVDTKQPIRAPYDNRQGGPFRIVDNQFVTTGDRGECHGVRIDGTYVIEFERNVLECQRGLRLGGGTEIVIRDNAFRGNDRVGIRVGGNVTASISGNEITGNGFSLGSLPSGGVVVWENGTADLGGGTLTIGGKSVHSPGNNILQGNGVADVNNLRAGTIVEAENNCWSGTDELEIQGDINGEVDYTPFNHTGAVEICDGVDNDCNGVIDDNCVEPAEPAAALCGRHGHVAWTAYRAETDSTDILYRTCSSPGGCGPVLTLAGGPDDQFRPAIACDGAAVIVAWEDTRLGTHDIFFRRSLNRGAWFEGTSVVTFENTDEHNPAVAMSGDLVIIAWEDHRPGNSDIRYKRSTDQGARFEPLEFLTTSPLDDRHVDVDIDGGLVVAAWENAAGGDRDVWYRHSDDGAFSWSDPEILVNDPTHASSPRVAMDGDVALIVWTDERNARDDLYYGQSFDGGAGFPFVSLLVGTPGSQDHRPTVALGGSDALVAWTSTGNGNPDLSFLRSGDSGQTWSPIGNLASPPSDDRDVDCAAGNGAVVCAWTDLGGGAPRPRVAASFDGGQTWPVNRFLD